jgi:hypothetical protein
MSLVKIVTTSGKKLDIVIKLQNPYIGKSYGKHIAIESMKSHKGLWLFVVPLRFRGTFIILAFSFSTKQKREAAYNHFSGRRDSP